MTPVVKPLLQMYTVPSVLWIILLQCVQYLQLQTSPSLFCFPACVMLFTLLFKSNFIGLAYMRGALGIMLRLLLKLKVHQVPTSEQS